MSSMDEPISDNSLFPTYYLSKQAAKEVKVVLSGREETSYFRVSSRFGVGAIKEDTTISLLDRLHTTLPFFKGKRISYLNIYLFWHDNRSVIIWCICRPHEDSFPRLLRSARAWIVRSQAEPLAFDREFYLKMIFSRKIDMATSYASIEGRVPLLDRAIVANAPRFNQEHLRGGVLRRFLRRSLPVIFHLRLCIEEKVASA